MLTLLALSLICRCTIMHEPTAVCKQVCPGQIVPTIRGMEATDFPILYITLEMCVACERLYGDATAQSWENGKVGEQACLY